MLPDIAPRFKLEQDRVEAMIRAAFAGVTRDGGVSWTESVVIDGDNSYRTTGEARAEDKDTGWEQLVDDPNWHHNVGIGGFWFLDAIGWRYYIAPAMIRCTRMADPALANALDADGVGSRDRMRLITSEQACAIVAFLQLMVAIDNSEEAGFEGYMLHDYAPLLEQWKERASRQGP